ncbi:Gfo/Idh/MocA family oxidoreductase [Luteococcus sp. H138]|uniref:Gfo/Idh/MocA family protein n=1 Tax=unclassified Luteococcus TaxID=2639923 RepID=UPI00313EE37D
MSTAPMDASEQLDARLPGQSNPPSGHGSPSCAAKPRTIVIGAHHWHVPLYAQALLETHHVVAITGIQTPTVVDLATLWECPILDSLDEALAMQDVQLAYVFGSHDQMADTCLDLIRRGIPFVVEKPLGTSLAELQAVRAAAEQAGVPATVPLIQRGGPVEQWLERVGAPVYERLSFIAGPPQRYLLNGNPWMLTRQQAGCGALANLGPHFIDMFLRHVNGSVAGLASNLTSTLHEQDVEDHATLIIHTDTGAEAIIEVGYAFPDSPLKRYCSYTSAGPGGFVSIDTVGTVMFTASDGHTETAQIDVDSDPLYDPFVRQVAATLNSGFAGMPTLAELEASMDIVWRARDADIQENQNG